MSYVCFGRFLLQAAMRENTLYPALIALQTQPRCDVRLRSHVGWGLPWTSMGLSAWILRQALDVSLRGWAGRARGPHRPQRARRERDRGHPPGHQGAAPLTHGPPENPRGQHSAPRTPCGDPGRPSEAPTTPTARTQRGQVQTAAGATRFGSIRHGGGGAASKLSGLIPPPVAKLQN